MEPETNYYQISGYRAHSNGWFKMYDDKPMIAAIVAEQSRLFRPGGRDSPVELFLGVLESGASYLLMTSEQMLDFTHRHRLKIPRDPWIAANFVSLSPIYFSTLEDLAAKIATYKQRPRNKNRREAEAPEDNSQANRGYVKLGSAVVHYRGYFEHQRTLYRLLADDLEPGKVGMAPPSWLGCVRVVSLVFEAWTADNRRRDERVKDPRLAGVGWTEATFPSFFDQLAPSLTVHLRFNTGVKYLNPNSRIPEFSQVIEDDQTGLYSRLRDLLSHDENKSGIPLIVLVHDEALARSVLAHAGIDVDRWSSGLANHLQLAPLKSRHKLEEEPAPPAVPKPCLVDTQKLVNALMETHPGDSVPLSAKVMHMQTDTKTCAGDDSLLQLRMWTAMAQGSAIDEQRKERGSSAPPCARVLAPATAPVQPGMASSAEVDPNDVDPNDVDVLPPERRPTIADDFSDDDDW